MKILLLIVALMFSMEAFATDSKSKKKTGKQKIEEMKKKAMEPAPSASPKKKK